MPNANLVAAQNQLRNLVSIYNRNFDQYQQATYEWAKETSAVNIRNAIEALRKQSK